MSLRPLLHQLIDYAGLFPPAGLPMDQAAANYAAERAGPDAWALARLIVPALRLDELAATGALDTPDDRWPISALVGPDPERDLAAIAAFNRRHAGRAVVDAVELKLLDATPLLAGELPLPAGVTAYVELPIHENPAPAVARLAARGLRAKLRCGGVSADAFPTPDAILRFLEACAAAGVPFKATAGLHHPLRGAFRLTYAPDSPRARMYGYLNLALAAAAVRAGAGPDAARALLLEERPDALAWDGDGVTWGDRRFSAASLAELRAGGLVAVGSCSFREPLDEAAQLYGAL